MILTVDTEKLANNTTLAALGRIAMLAATLIGLPVAGFMMQRIITTGDAIAAKLDDNVTATRLLQQKVDYGFDAARKEADTIRIQIVDHEGRIRIIEREIRRTP